MSGGPREADSAIVDVDEKIGVPFDRGSFLEASISAVLPSWVSIPMDSKNSCTQISDG
jgi:hypothetical protein